MDTNKMREQVSKEFEVFYTDYEKSREANGWMPLETHVVVHMRNAWIASREAVVVELPKVVGFEGAYDSLRNHEFCPRMSDVEDADEIFSLCRRIEAREAIEAQGLKCGVAP